MIVTNFVILGEKLQLIEIVQLVLVGFISISAFIFLFAYLGYRRKKINSTKQPKINSSNQITVPEIPITQIPKTENKNSTLKSCPPITKKEVIKNFEAKNSKSRFEVFKPKKEKEHLPKVLKIKIPKEDQSNIN